MSEGAPGPRQARRLWEGVGAIALLVGLAVGAFTLYDRLNSGPLRYAGDLSTAAGARAFVSFAESHSGSTAQLDLSCIDDGVLAACVVEPGLNNEVLVWAFASSRCFSTSSDPAVSTCQGGNVFFVGSTEGTAAFIGNGATGAGSVVLRGPFHILDTGPGGSIFPANIRTFRLTPAGA